ncbi:MAG: RNA polymerase sigma factor [Planctomycetota bacterium]|jgi:RNA polymerase sigma-70 factor (ECF subfamily)
MTTEEQMIQEVLDGKTESFRWIIERYQRPIIQMVFNLIADRHAAEDVAQEVFIAVYQKLSTFDPMRCRFSTWLFTIARNKSINYLRKKRPLSMDSQQIESSVKSDDPLREQEFFQQMDAALNQLPKGQKRAFVLAEFENLPYDQIAQIECVSIGTVKSRIHRAKMKLRKALKNVTGEES